MIDSSLQTISLLDAFRESWRKATDEYSFSQEVTVITPFAKFDAEYARIKDAIVVAANRSVPKTPRQLSMFWRN